MTPLLFILTYCSESTNLTLSDYRFVYGLLRLIELKQTANGWLVFQEKIVRSKSTRARLFLKERELSLSDFGCSGLFCKLLMAKILAKMQLSRASVSSASSITPGVQPIPLPYCPCMTSSILQLRIRKKFRQLYAGFQTAVSLGEWHSSTNFSVFAATW